MPKRKARTLFIALAVLGGFVLNIDPLHASPGSPQEDPQDWESIDPFAGGVCNENLCRAFEELAKVMNGQMPDVNFLNSIRGPDDPRDMFNSPGSQNISVIARAALYHWNHDGGWLWNYYLIQHDPGAPYFLDREIFSSVYTHGVIGATIAVLKHALDRADTAMINRASLHLRRYWAFLSLAAVLPDPTTWIAYNKWGTVSQAAGPWWGYNVAIVGRRVYANGFDGSSTSAPGTGAQGLLLAMALQHPSRDVTADLRSSPAYWGGVRAAVEACGYTLNSGGKVDLQSHGCSPEQFGLSSSQRSTLSSFIANGGTSGAAGVIGLLGNQQVSNDITIIRAGAQVVSWFGRSGANGFPPGDAKGGPWFFARSQGNFNLAHFVTRSTDKWGAPQGGWTYRSGNSVCAKHPTDELPVICQAFPSNIIYEVLLSRNGVQCIAGNC